MPAIVIVVEGDGADLLTDLAKWIRTNPDMRTLSDQELEVRFQQAVACVLQAEAVREMAQRILALRGIEAPEVKVKISPLPPGA